MTGRDLLAAATPRPWMQDGGTWYTPNGYASGTRNWNHDSALIVAAVNEYEALLDIADVLLDARWLLGMSVSNSIGARADGALARLEAVRSGSG